MNPHRSISSIRAHLASNRQFGRDIERIRKEIEANNRAIDSEIDDAMRDAGLPIEDEMIRIFEEQEDEVMRNLEEKFRKIGAIEVHQGSGYVMSKETRAFFLTADSLLDFPRWIGETASRLSGYVRGTMQSGWCMGLALLGKDCTDQIEERYIRAAIDVLTPLNENITRTSKEKIEDMVREALERELSIDEFRDLIRELFTRWRVNRPYGVSVFNVTFPFNSALVQSYKANGIEHHMWVNQEMMGNFQGNLRDTHRVAGGQVVRIGDKFSVGKAKLLHPGDLSQINVSGEEVWGCRCAVRPVLDPGA